jgi:SAM-dependent methyltransferase
MTTDYSKRFQSREGVSSYESVEYGSDSYSALVWEVQKPFLEKLVRDHSAQVGGLNILDFACGSGRLTHFLEEFTNRIRGADISKEMLEVAAQRCQKATFACGDVCSDESFVGTGYNLVTAFRFFLNVEPPLRTKVLSVLRKAIDAEKGLFIFNIHGSSCSLRHFVIQRRRRQLARQPDKIPADVMLNEIHPSEMENMLRSNGFAVVKTIGFGLLPSGFYRGKLRKLAAFVDRMASGSGLARYFGIDLIYVCRPV